MSSHKSSTVTIHKAELADTDRLAYLTKELADYEGLNCAADAQSYRRIIENTDEEPTPRVYVAKKDGEVIAFMMFYPGYDLLTDAYGYHLADLCVEKPYRGQGIGKQMMQFLALHTLRSGREWVSLTALQENDGAAKFYESLQMVKMPVHFFASNRTILSSIGA